MSNLKAIKSLNLNNRETSYANSVLQVFTQLEHVQNWMKSLMNSNDLNSQFFSTTLTKALSIQLYNLSNGIEPDSSQIIKTFEVKSQFMWNKTIPQDPYHFLHYFLKLLHCENNLPSTKLFDWDYYNQKMKEKICNDMEMFNLFNNYLQQTQNSFISNNFNNIQKYVLNCPFCLMMFNYGEKKIIRFNLDDILLIRKEKDPLINKQLSLNDCFRYSNELKKTNCQMCNQNTAYELKKIYNSSEILIIEFNRKNNKTNYKNDVKFYLDFDINSHIINDKCNNKKYKLKGIVCRYGLNKYFADVLINSKFYRFMDCKEGKDVKEINNINELLIFEPQLLFYEVNFQNNNISKRSPSTEDLQSTMKINLNLITNVPFGSKMYSLVNYFTLKFLVIPQIWDQNLDNAITINTQVSDNFTLKNSIDRFFIKLGKPRDAIINFSINNVQLDVNSQQKLKDMNINENSIIYALKSTNFEELPSINN